MMNTALKGAKMEDIEIRLYDAIGGEKTVCSMSIAQERESQDLPVEASEAFSRRRSRESFHSR